MARKERVSFSGFYKKTILERANLVAQETGLTNDEIKSLENGLDIHKANLMVENVIGKYELPLGIATNFVIDGVEKLIPMVIEEASVVAGASNVAKIVSRYGGFITEANLPLLKGQIQIIPKDYDLTQISRIIDAEQNSLIALGNSLVPNLVKRGGGISKIELTSIPNTQVGPMASVDVLVNTADAMGANLVNKICEGLAKEIGRLTGARVNLCILSNYADQRLATARCQISIHDEDLSLELAQRIVEAQVFAEENIERAVTHNKGILNGIDAVALATGQDWRAIEAGAHAYAAKGKYGPLTKWAITDGFLKGELKLPLVVGTVGGITDYHPVAAASLKILDVKSSQDLARLMAAVGLAQNFSALLSLVGRGIRQGHGSLHRRKDN